MSGAKTHVSTCSLETPQRKINDETYNGHHYNVPIAIRVEGVVQSCDWLLSRDGSAVELSCLEAV